MYTSAPLAAKLDKNVVDLKIDVTSIEALYWVAMCRESSPTV